MQYCGTEIGLIFMSFWIVTPNSNLPRSISSRLDSVRDIKSTAEMSKYSIPPKMSRGPQ